MSRKLRTAAIIVGSLFLIILILNIIVNRFLSEDRLRTMIIKPAQEVLGRTVTIGSVDVSLLSGITLSAIKIKEQDQSRDFIIVDQLILKYELLPLLQKKLVISKFIIDNPKIRIIRWKNGLFNLTGIGRQNDDTDHEIVPVAETALSEPLPFTVTFDQLEISKAIITLTDEAGILPEVTGEANLTASITPGETIKETRYNGSFNLLANGEYHGFKPVLQLSCAISEELISYNGKLTVGFDSVDLEGSAAKLLSTPIVELNLKVSSIDLDKMASLKQFINDTPGNPPPGPIPAQKIGPDPTKTENPAPLQGPLASPPDLAPEAGLKLAILGNLHIGKISNDRMEMREIAASYLFQDDLLTFEKGRARIFGGDLTGGFSTEITTIPPEFRGEIKGKKIKVGEFMLSLNNAADTFSGEIDANLTFQGLGRKWSTIRDTLDGGGHFTIAEGTIHQAPLTKAMAALLKTPDLEDLNFNDFSGDFTILNGKASLDAHLQGQNINILALGEMGLDGSLDLPLTLQLSPEYGSNPAIAQHITEVDGHQTLNLLAEGSIREPRLTVAGIAESLPKNQMGN